MNEEYEDLKAFQALFDVLDPLEAEAQKRVLKSVMVLLEIEIDTR